jgi:hypothetical protein
MIASSFAKTPARVFAMLPNASGKEIARVAKEWIDCGCGHMVTTSVNSVSAVGTDFPEGIFHPHPLE